METSIPRHCWDCYRDQIVARINWPVAALASGGTGRLAFVPRMALTCVPRLRAFEQFFVTYHDVTFEVYTMSLRLNATAPQRHSATAPSAPLRPLRHCTTAPLCHLFCCCATAAAPLCCCATDTVLLSYLAAVLLCHCATTAPLRHCATA